MSQRGKTHGRRMLSMARVFSHCSSSLRSGSHPPHDRLTTMQRRPPKPRATAVPAISGSLRPVLSRNCEQAAVMNATERIQDTFKPRVAMRDRVPQSEDRISHVPRFNYIYNITCRWIPGDSFTVSKTKCIQRLITYIAYLIIVF